MTGEDAISRIKARFDKWALDDEDMKAIKTLIPELAESEDERIIEEIKFAVMQMPSSRQDTKNRCLAWLEKQKEQKPAEPSSSNNESEYDRGYRDGKSFQLEQVEQYSIGKTFMGLIPCWVDAPSTLQPAHKYHGKNAVIMHENNGGFMCCFIDDEEATVAHLPENTGFVEGWRKKPAGWSKEDEAMIKSILFVLESYVSQSESASSPSLITTYPTYYKEIDWLKSLRPQSKQEWSEEDERILKGIIGLIDHDQHYGVSNNEMISWLKTLRPQLKQKWSEEDKKMLWIIQLALTKHPITDKQEKDAFDWLNSLRPQPHTVSTKDATKFGNLEYERGVKDGIQSEKSRQWKPSKKQMTNLLRAEGRLRIEGENIIASKLAKLYEQLKKLI